MTNINSFIFDSYDFDIITGSLIFNYSFDNGLCFQESYKLPSLKRELSIEERKAINQAIQLLYLFVGVSYYKAFVPDKLTCNAFALDEPTADFVKTVYYNGLAEFSYRNKLNLKDKINFTNLDPSTNLKPQSMRLSDHRLVLVGGGKDSIVTIEHLKKMNKPITLFAVGPKSGIADAIYATIKKAQLPSIVVTRQISNNIVKINKSGAYNGHVPITAIISMVAILTAMIVGYDTVITSNEHSADAPNLISNDQAVNHQYSKSSEFERTLSEYLNSNISHDLNYFSFLRPLTETAIVKRFSVLENYHSVFRSCNSNFKQNDQERQTNWCCSCPKCFFVFLALAPFVSKEQLINIFGENLLNNSKNIHGFSALCGVSDHKPFECVGEVHESKLLLSKLSKMSDWKNDIVIKAIKPKLNISMADFDSQYLKLFSLKKPHYLSQEYLKALDI